MSATQILLSDGQDDLFSDEKDGHQGGADPRASCLLAPSEIAPRRVGAGNMNAGPI